MNYYLPDLATMKIGVLSPTFKIGLFLATLNIRLHTSI